MSTLRSAIDELQISELGYVSDAELVSDLDEIEHAERRLAAERSRRLVELERRRIHEVDGHLSLATWLGARYAVPPSVTSGQVRLGRALEAMPRVAAALGDGSLSVQAARLLARAFETSPDAFARCEDELLEAAMRLPLAGLRAFVEHLRQAPDLVEAEREMDQRFGRRRLHVSPTLDGMVRVDGDLDPRDRADGDLGAAGRDGRRVADERAGGCALSAATPSRRARRALSVVARRRAPADGGRRASPRDGHARSRRRSRVAPVMPSCRTADRSRPMLPAGSLATPT